MSIDKDSIRSKILDLVTTYYESTRSDKPFIPGETPIPVSGKVYDALELKLLIDASLDFWLTTGRYAAQFEKDFAAWFGLKFSLLTNSGSSANLLALSALTSHELGEKRLKPGDEVITCASGFPTTINPIIQNNLIPVFIDAEIPTYNPDVKYLEAALSKKTRAIFLAHTLGNPFDLAAVKTFAEKHNLWLIEDCCDAVGSKYDNKLVGTLGHLATVSFYPAHHMTMGEGGCVLTNNPQLKKLVESFRDWGRDCWCDPGKSNTCGKRFDWQLGELPKGYDHKYTYSHIGYNLKLTDMQAAVGVAQLKKLPSFIETRKKNFHILYEGLKDLQDTFILPEATRNSDPSWFGFPISVKPDAPFTRDAAVRFLEDRKIATRQLFAGNLTKQPAYHKIPYRKIGKLPNADFIMNSAFWVGVYPGIKKEMLDHILVTLHILEKSNSARRL